MYQGQDPTRGFGNACGEPVWRAQHPSPAKNVMLCLVQESSNCLQVEVPLTRAHDGTGTSRLWKEPERAMLTVNVTLTGSALPQRFWAAKPKKLTQTIANSGVRVRRGAGRFKRRV